MQLTDAPFPFASVASADLFVVRIDGQLADADSSVLDDSLDDNDNGGNHDVSKGWVTLATPNQSYNLLDLQGGKTVNLGQVTLPTGTYRGFRLILDTDKSSVTLTDGTVLTGNSTPGIKFPSAGKTGIKVELAAPIQITTNETVMVIDFDLGRSFVMRGNSIEHNGLLFKPVIRGTARDVAGAISGTVRALSDTGAVVGGATVELLAPGTVITDTASANVIATTGTDSTGKYAFAFLRPGTYAVRARPPAADTTLAPALVPTVVVPDNGAVTGIDLVLPQAQ